MVLIDAYRPYYNGQPKDHNVDVYAWLDQPYGAPDIYYDVTYHDDSEDPYYEHFTAEIPVYFYSTGSELNLEVKAEDDNGNRAYDDTTFSVITTVDYDMWLEEGWNVMNIPDTGCDDAPEHVFASLDPNDYWYIFEKSTAHSYLPDRGIQTLNHVDTTDTYYIKMKNASRFYIDSTCPDITVDHPTEGYEFENECFDGPISGYVCDTETGVKEVTLTIYDENSCCQNYWDGEAWVSSETKLDCIFDENTHSWYYDGTTEIDLKDKSGDKIILTACATDFAGCTCCDTSFFYFNDTNDPTITITNPIDSHTYECEGPEAINGTAYDGDCETYVSDVTISLRRNVETFSDNWWDGANWVSTETELACDYDEMTETWEYNGALPVWENDYAYTVFAYAYDAADNVANTHKWFDIDCCEPELIIEKTVWREDMDVWDEYTEVEIGEVVTFNVTIHIPEEACPLFNGYLDDYLPNGLEYIEDSISILAVLGDYSEYAEGEDVEPQQIPQAESTLLRWTSEEGYEDAPAGVWIYIEYEAEVTGIVEALNYAIGTGYYNCCDTISDDDNAGVVVICEEPEEYDFGDAPYNGDNLWYPTLLANNGAYHTIEPMVFLGDQPDSETDGQPTNGADGDDDYDLWDDEDGVEFTTDLILGESATVIVNASTFGYLDAWIDFDMSGNWSSDEKIFDAEYLDPGDNVLNFNVPCESYIGNTYARFRFNTIEDNGLECYGPAEDGEVEDYVITIQEDNQPCTPSYTINKYTWYWAYEEWYNSYGFARTDDNYARFKIEFNVTGDCPIVGDIFIRDRLPENLTWDSWKIFSPDGLTLTASYYDEVTHSLYFNFTGTMQPDETIMILFNATYEGCYEAGMYSETNWASATTSVTGTIEVCDSSDIVYNWWEPEED